MACCRCCCGGVDCAEGDQGKCCCGGGSGTCCQESEYCCSGVCEPEPCGCTCDCELPEGGSLPTGNTATDPWTDCYETCSPELVGDNWVCGLGCQEFQGVTPDSGVLWDEGYLEANSDCTFLSVSAWAIGTYEGIFFRIYKCDGDAWVDVSEDAVVSDGATFSGGWWCTEDTATPDVDVPPVCNPLP